MAIAGDCKSPDLTVYIGSSPIGTTNLCPYVPEIDRAVSAKDIYAGASPVADSNLRRFGEASAHVPLKTARR